APRHAPPPRARVGGRDPGAPGRPGRGAGRLRGPRRAEGAFLADARRRALVGPPGTPRRGGSERRDVLVVGAEAERARGVDRARHAAWGWAAFESGSCLLAA